MVRFIRELFKELYTWLIINLENEYVAYAFSYIIIVLFQLSNIYTLVLLTQKLLGITLIAFIASFKVYLIVLVFTIGFLDYIITHSYWKKKRLEMDVDLKHWAFAYTLITAITFGLAYFAL